MWKFLTELLVQVRQAVKKKHFRTYAGSVAAVIAVLALFLSNIESLFNSTSTLLKFIKKPTPVVTVSIAAPDKYDSYALDGAYVPGKYVYREAKDAFYVRPELNWEFVHSKRNDNPIQGIETAWASAKEIPLIYFPTAGLDITSLNNTKETIMIHELIISVESSERDTTPLLFVETNVYNDGYVTFVNEGWCDIDNAVADYDIVKFSDSENPNFNNLAFRTNIEFDGRFGNLFVYESVEKLSINAEQYTHYVQTLKKTSEIMLGRNLFGKKKPAIPEWYCYDLVKDLKLDQLQKIYKEKRFRFEKPEDIASCLPVVKYYRDNYSEIQRASKYLNAFDSDSLMMSIKNTIKGEYLDRSHELNLVSVILIGKLTYDCHGVSRGKTETHREVAYFKTPVVLIGDPRIGGQEIGVTGTYGLKLFDDKKSYVVKKSIGQEIKPGETDRFSIYFNVPRSSRHRFKVTMRYNGNEYLDLGWIDYEIVVPQSVAELLSCERNAGCEQHWHSASDQQQNGDIYGKQ